MVTQLVNGNTRFWLESPGLSGTVPPGALELPFSNPVILSRYKDRNWVSSNAEEWVFHFQVLSPSTQSPLWWGRHLWCDTWGSELRWLLQANLPCHLLALPPGFVPSNPEYHFLFPPLWQTNPSFFFRSRFREKFLDHSHPLPQAGLGTSSIGLPLSQSLLTFYCNYLLIFPHPLLAHWKSNNVLVHCCRPRN